MNIQTEILYGILILLVLLATWMLYTFNKQDNNTFNLVDFLIDPTTDRASPTRLGMLTALVSTTWALVYLVINNTLTEWFYTGYLGVWVLGYLSSKAITSYSDKKDAGNNGTN